MPDTTAAWLRRRLDARTPAAARYRGYQRRDFEVIDYGLVPLPETHLEVRGPLPDLSVPGSYFACLGAAQTYGTFTPSPFPALVSDDLRLPVLNLGFGGAGPRFFLDDPRLLRYANDARFVVLQVMSGRSEDNEMYESRGGSHGFRPADGTPVSAVEVFRELVASGDEERIRRVVGQSRANWVRSYQSLLERIEVPIILLWFSKRTPDYEESWTDVNSLYGEFPQLVVRSMVDALRPSASDYVECVTERGSPQLLVSRFTGEPVELELPGRTWTHNRYYPTPEMHEDVRDVLLPACRRLA